MSGRVPDAVLYRMSRPRVFLGLTVAEYADAHKVSQRTARRRIASMPGAVKTGRGWRVPFPATEYAKRTGKSASTLRRKGFRLGAGESLADAMKRLNPPPLRQRALEHFAEMVVGSPKLTSRLDTINARYARATDSQLREVLKITPQSLRGEFGRDEYDVTMPPGNVENLLFYHD